MTRTQKGVLCVGVNSKEAHSHVHIHYISVLHAQNKINVKLYTCVIVTFYNRCDVGVVWVWCECDQNIPEVKKKLAPMLQYCE